MVIDIDTLIKIVSVLKMIVFHVQDMYTRIVIDYTHILNFDKIHVTTFVSIMFVSIMLHSVH